MGDLASEIRQLLADAGMHAILAFPRYGLPHLVTPMVAVSQAEITARPYGFSDYLGLSSNQPAFGSELEFLIQLDIYSPQRLGGAACAEAVDTALTAVLSGLSSCTLKNIQVSPIHYDENVDFLRSSLRLTFGALFYQLS